MFWPCLTGRVSFCVSKSPLIRNVNERLIKPSSAYIVQLPYYHHLVSGTNSSKKLPVPVENGWKSTMPIKFPMQFSTSSSLLAQHKNHDHSKLWTFERVLSAILLPLVPASLFYPSQAVDTVLALTFVLHAHLGLEAIVVDYVRPILFGEAAPKICLGLLYLFSIVTLAGLLNLIYNDAGLANTIITVWKK